MEEIWKDIPNYEGLYQVSNLGRVKSLERTKWNGRGMQKVEEKILKVGNNRGGYLYVVLSKAGRHKRYTVHRLVLITFNPVENMEQLEVDHINTIRTDNKLENLRWTTCKENRNNPLTRKHNSEAHKDKYKGENHPCYGKHGAKNPNSIPVVQLTITGELVEVYEAAREAKKNGFIPSNVTNCIKGNRKTHCGYKWLYLHEYVLQKYPRITELNLFGKTYNQKEVNN